MVFFRQVVLTVTLALSLTLGQGISQSPPPSLEPSCRAAMVAFAANWHSFPFYRCRYSITSGLAASVEDALAGKLTGAVSCTILQLVDDKSELLDVDAGPPPDPKNGIRRKDGTKYISAAFSTFGYLGDGKREIRYSPGVRSINLLPLDSRTGPENATPLNMEFLGHLCRQGPDFFESEKDVYESVYVGPEIVDGASLITVRFRNKRKRDEITFSFDPKRGYLPARYQCTVYQNFEPKVYTSRSYLLAARECSQGRWCPERVVRIDFDKRGPALFVRDMRVLDLDVDHHPDKKAFQLRCPAGTYVCYRANSRNFFRLKQDEKIGLADLERLYTMVDESKTNKLMDTAISRPSRARWWAWGGGGLGAIVFLAGLTLLVRRWRLRPS